MAAGIKAAKAQAAKHQVAVDAWEAQIVATNLALELRFAADMQKERAAEARKERAMTADTKAAKAQVVKTQAAVDAWEAQVAATDLALELRFAADMQEERAAEARKERAMTADTKAAKAQVAKTQAAVDVWEAQVVATDIALKMRFEDDMREERAAEARKDRADNERLEANTRAVALKHSGFELIKAANAARMATEEGQAEQRLKLEKLMDRRMR